MRDARSAGPAALVQRQRDRAAAASARRRVGGPDRIGSGRGDAVARPAEPGEIGVRRAGRREQADRRRVLRDRLAVCRLSTRSSMPRALQVDRAGERGRVDADARASRPAPSARSRTAAGAVGARARRRAWAATLVLPSSIFVTGGLAVGKKLLLDQRPAEQDQRRDHREQHEIATVFVQDISPQHVREPDRSRARPRDGTARSAARPASPPWPRHSGEAP